MNDLIEVDELRANILKITEQIRVIINAIPEAYDALKTISEKHQGIYGDIHFREIRADFEMISEIATEADEIIGQAEKKSRVDT